MTQTDEIKLGDLVVLKSGGPTMSVASDSTPNQLKCVWLVEGVYHANFFHVATLKPAPPISTILAQLDAADETVDQTRVFLYGVFTGLVFALLTTVMALAPTGVTF
jgi:uncharacterized protein YodC (DUF2158 family)